MHSHGENHFRYRTGDRTLQVYKVDADTEIAIGDLLWYDASDDTVYPASDFTWDTNLATTQAAFADAFVGVAYGKSAVGQADPIDVDVNLNSVFSYETASAEYEVGDTVGPAKDTGNNLMNQRVAAAVAASSVGRVFRATDGAQTEVRVTFGSSRYPAVNANAQVG